MEPLLKSPVQLAEPEALPFRVIFEEHRRRRNSELVSKARKVLFHPDEAPEDSVVAAALREKIEEQEAAYEKLKAANDQIETCEEIEPSKRPNLDGLLEDCEKADRPLKQILHLMDTSALCLSGGGIRSASFCLGVLEGLSRFSRSGSEDSGLMDRLDYLSTVSGGGYIGSWMMSWVYRRMAARLDSGLMGAFDLVEESIQAAQAACSQVGEYLEPADPQWAVKGENAQAFLDQFDDLTSACDRAVENARSAANRARKLADIYPGEAAEYLSLASTAVEAANSITNARNTFKNKKPGIGQRLGAFFRKLLGTKPAPLPVSNEVVDNLEQLSHTLAVAIEMFMSNRDWEAGYREVVSALAGKGAVTGGDPEPAAVHHLRSYTSFLAPALGLTLDTFTLAAIVLRNLIINWTMLIPVLFALVAVPQCSRFLFPVANAWLSSHGGPVLGVVITLIFLVAAIAAAVALPSHHEQRFGFPPAELFRRYGVGIFLGAVVLGSWFLTASWTPGEQMVHWSDLLPRVIVAFVRRLPATVRVDLATSPIALLGFGAVSLSIFLAYKRRVAQHNLNRWRRKAIAVVMVTLAAIVIGAITSSLLVLVQHKVFQRLLPSSGWEQIDLGNGNRLFVVFALPLVISALLISASLFCALLGLYEMEEDREWWVRCGGWLLAFNVMWILAHAVALYGVDETKRVIAGVSGLVLGLTGSAIGYSGATAAGPRPIKSADMGKVAQFLAKHNLVMPAIAVVSLGLIAMGMVAGEEKLRMMYLPALNTPVKDELYSSVAMFAVFGALAVLVNCAININIFSLHGMYRMRLMRAFLGASNVFRQPNPFTKFDPKDTPHETDLPSAPGVPLHIINTTLNLVGTRKTAWLQRKAECFTFSPIHCGCWRLGYVPANIYGGSRGVSLATAMSISGAAFNPNMGYQSSPLLALLMTFFNLRLGFWLPNPSRPHSIWGRLAAQNASFFNKSGPSFALQPMIEEALGLTNDTFRWVELTDGGHFENLGLYEMVMRRCKRILLIDAGADPKCQFEDLGNALRKIYIDFGIPIEFPEDMKMKPGMDPANSHCAIAKIRYSCVDTARHGEHPASLDGELIYIKAGLTGGEPVDILQYAMTRPTFPHEATANQFYNESQFESYRHLGSWIVDEIARMVSEHSARSIAEFGRAACRYWSQAGPKQEEPKAAPKKEPRPKIAPEPVPDIPES